MFNVGMNFELTMRLFLGEKAYHIAGQEANEKYRREWLKKATKKMLRRVDAIETTTRHKQMLITEVEKLLDSLKGKKPSSWAIVYCLFRLCGRLVGFDFLRGSILHTPFYYQEVDQYYTGQILNGEDTMQDFYDRKDAVSTRKRLIEQLKEESFTDFKISLIMNTTEYQVKKIRKGL